MTALRMCELGQISRASLYRWAPEAAHEDPDLDLRSRRRDEHRGQDTPMYRSARCGLGTVGSLRSHGRSAQPATYRGPDLRQ
jgi:hypothetical protein